MRGYILKSKPLVMEPEIQITDKTFQKPRIKVRFFCVLYVKLEQLTAGHFFCFHHKTYKCMCLLRNVFFAFWQQADMNAEITTEAIEIISMQVDKHMQSSNFEVCEHRDHTLYFISVGLYIGEQISSRIIYSLVRWQRGT